MHSRKSMRERCLAPSDADAVSPSRQSRQAHALVMVVAVAALGASAGLNFIDDPRPLDVQLSAVARQAGQTLQGWQGQLSRGMQVSLRAVADGSELPPADPPVVAHATASQATPAPDVDDRDQPVSAAPKR